MASKKARRPDEDALGWETIMDPELETRLRALLDKQEISETLLRYSRGVDRADPPLIASVFHPDAVDDHGNQQLLGEDLPARFAGNTRPSPQTGQMKQHFIGNQLIELHGEEAFAESYFVSYSVVEHEGKEYTRVRGARFLDRLERREGTWRIAHRVVADDWNRFDEVVRVVPGSDAWRRGALRFEDPGYQQRSGALRDEERRLRAELRSAAGD